MLDVELDLHPKSLSAPATCLLWGVDFQRYRFYETRRTQRIDVVTGFSAAPIAVRSA